MFSCSHDLHILDFFHVLVVYRSEAKPRDLVLLKSKVLSRQIKIPTYGRHWISWLMRIVGPIQKCQFKKKSQERKIVMCPMICVKCHMSHVTCHQHQQQEPQPLALLTNPLCIVSWFTNKELIFFLLSFYLKKMWVLCFSILAMRSSTRSLQNT